MRRHPVLILALMLPATPALAAGFALREQSTEAMGEAYAGAAATNTDATFLAYNPAAASAAGNGDFAISAIGILPTSSAAYATALTAAGTPAGGNTAPTDFIRNAVIPDIAARYRIDPQWSLGLSVSVPWGLATKYPDGWAGRYYALGSKVSTVNISPVVAYDVTPDITVAGGFQAQYMRGILSSAVDIGTIAALNHLPGAVPGATDGSATVTAAGWGYGFLLGGRANLDGGWTLGISYRSRVYYTLNGTEDFTLDSVGFGAAINHATGLFTNTTASAKIATPDQLDMGLRKDLGDGWAVLGEADWTDWTSFKNLTVNAGNPVQPPDVTVANWNSSWLLSLGGEYQAADNLALRLGTAIDGTPNPQATLAPRIPDATRIWIAAGVTWHAAPEMDVKFSAAHLFNDTRSIDQTAAMTGNTLRGTLIGSTASNVNVVGASLDYHW